MKKLLATLALALTTTAYAAAGTTAAPADLCPNAAVRAQQNANNLPDCRAYELVNPPGDDVGEVNRMPYASDDGNVVTYMSVIPGNDAFGAGVSSTAVARRTATGWSSESADMASLGPIYGKTGLSSPKAFSPDFSRALFISDLPGVPSDTDWDDDVYRVNVGFGTATLINDGFDSFPEQIPNATPDLGQIAFTKGAGSLQPTGIYLSDGSNHVLMTGTYPDGEADGAPPQPAGPGWVRGWNVPGTDSSSTYVEHGGQHGLSDDAQRLYFIRRRALSDDLFVRDLKANPARTVGVSVSSRTGDVGTMYDGKLLMASHDGSEAYFMSPVQLTDASPSGGGIYHFDLASQTVTPITAADSMGGAIASDDMSHIYFTSTSALEGEAQLGDTNAYVWTREQGVRFLAKVTASDLFFQFRRVTEDGRYALLITAASLDGAANDGKDAVYRYDDMTGDIACASCRPDGSPSQGVAALEGQSPGFPGAALTRNRALTPDGQVLFMSTDQIVPGDLTPVTDVYLYHDGTASLISSGNDDVNTYPGDISDDAKTISFVTRAKLVGADRDPEEYDVYAARVDGGFLEPPAPTDPCRGDDCQGPAGGAPALSTPSSSRTADTGNISPPRVARRLRVARLSAIQRARLAREGVVTLKVRVAGGGRLTVRARGRVGGRTKTLASARKVVATRGATTVPVRVRLSRVAKRQLSRSGRLRVTFVTRLGGLSRPKSITVNLTRAPR
jgi:hypothetical protein